MAFCFDHQPRQTSIDVGRPKTGLFGRSAVGSVGQLDAGGRLLGRRLSPSPQRVFDLRGEKFRVPSRSLSKDKKFSDLLAGHWRPDDGARLDFRNSTCRRESLLEKNIKELHENIAWKCKMELYESTIERLCRKARDLQQENKRLKLLVSQIRKMEERVQQESVEMADLDQKRSTELHSIFAS